MVPAFVCTVALLATVPQDAAEPPPSRRIGEHANPILQLAVSPDGELLVTAARDEAHAWDLKKGELRWKSSLPEMEVAALGVGEELVVYSFGIAAVSFLDLESGAARSGIGGTTATMKSRCLAVDPKDRWIWIGTDEGIATRVVPGSVNSWSNRRLDNGGVTCLAMDAKGTELVAGGEDGSLRFVNAKSANVDDKRVIEAHDAPVAALAIDPKGGVVCSASEKGELRAWRVSSGKELHLLKEAGPRVGSLAIDPKGRLLAAGDAEGAIELWDLKKGERVAALPSAGEGAVTGLAFVEKGDTLAASSAKGTQVVLWDLSKL